MLLTYPLRGGSNTVWNVLAEPTPGATAIQIGTIEMTGSFVKSLWGDTRMFFRHQAYGEDLDHITTNRRDWIHFTEDDEWEDSGNEISDLPTNRADADDVIQAGLD